MHFKDYANYYNLLYKDKNYREEVDYINRLINKHNPGARTLIDLGCGTGNHAFEFERSGLHTTGVDLSAQMIAVANKNKAEKGSEAVFYEGDIRSYRSGSRYDCVVSLFHVMSYQTTNADLSKAFDTAKQLMENDGIFIFDCWYGPGVHTDLPASRTKIFEDELLKVTRKSSSLIDFNRSTVDVKFNVTIENKITKEKNILEELHPMRFIFRNEIEFLAENNGMKIEALYNWMSTDDPSEKSWYAVFVLKNK
jgi:SAM-dependent methyltransferase